MLEDVGGGSKTINHELLEQFLEAVPVSRLRIHSWHPLPERIIASIARQISSWYKSYSK